MIEKCSIGNMSYNIQNITLIILILILIIVIIYYLKNSSTKHDELIEKYTSPTTTDINIDDNMSYISHNTLPEIIEGITVDTENSSQIYSNFPTDGTVVTLRPCQVQFNNTFSNGKGIHKYVYEDDWQEIDTIKTSNDTTPQKIEKKIISKKNETNKDDVKDGKSVFTNYSEHSKCFKLISGSDNKYRYADNDLIKYNSGEHVKLALDDDSAPDNYMQMEFDLKPANSSYYYDNLTSSICSLQYAEQISDLSGDLIRFTLNRNNIITDIDRVTIDPTNNHIFIKDPSFEISNLITTGNSGSYSYNRGLKMYEYKVSNSGASAGIIAIINLYKFDRNLLCDKKNSSGDIIYQNIKTYKKLTNAKIDVSKLINFNLPATKKITNTEIPSRYINDTTINGNNYTQGTLFANIDTLINSQLIEVNNPINNRIRTLTAELATLETTRNTFIDSNKNKQNFINNAIIKTNYDDLSLKYNELLNTTNYKLTLGKVEYYNVTIAKNDSSVKLSPNQEPTFKEIITNGESEIYEIMVCTHDGRSDVHTPYEITFDNETECDILIVAGGGGGGMDMGGGGGGGGVIEFKKVKIAPGKHYIRVGKGGDGAPAGNTNGQPDRHQFTINGKQGANSSFNNYVAIGGGYGGSSYQGHTLRGKGGDGGSGGGSTGYCEYSDSGKAGKGTKNQGNDGGYGAGAWYGAGGGGAGEVGGGPSTEPGGAKGGDGRKSDILGTEYYWGGGGGGAGYSTRAGNGGLGGGGGGAGGGGITSGGDGYFVGQSGGGGCAGCWAQTRGGNGAPHTGGGGGGGAHYNRYNDGGKGGSGIVIIRFKKYAARYDNNRKIITFQNATFKNEENTTIRIFNKSESITLNANTEADVLIVGGGGGGAKNDGWEGGGGGGGGGVIHAKLKMPDTSTTLNIAIGAGGQQDTTGNPSSITYNNNSSRQIKLVANGGGRGGGSYAGCGDGKGGIGKPGGSGGGGSGFCYNLEGGETSQSKAITNSNVTGIRNKSNIENLDSSLISYTYYGNNGGLGHNASGGSGGGGAGAEGIDTPGNWQTSGTSGGVGVHIPIFDNKSYAAGGAGSVAIWGRGELEAYGQDLVRGGYGGGGDASLRGIPGSDGLENTGSGGGGSSAAAAGRGGSGIVIVRYTNDNTKHFRIRFPLRTYVTIVGGANDTSQYLHGTYMVSITPVITTISIDEDNPIEGVDTISLTRSRFISNKIDFIYNLYKTIENINIDQLSVPAGRILSNAYLNNIGDNIGLPLDSRKYNKYKISTYISKSYKKGNNIDFNFALYTTDNILIPSEYYNIRCVFSDPSSNNIIIPIDIYIAINAIHPSIAGTHFIARTYQKNAQNLNGAEIYPFISNGTGQNANSIADFNNLNDWTTSLTEKNVWGIITKNENIQTEENSKITLANIANKCNITSLENRSQVCDINTLINIKNTITTTPVSSGKPEIKKNISITYTGLFPTTTARPALNYSIADYISYESSKQKAPDDRITKFNILDSATKYLYFAIPTE